MHLSHQINVGYVIYYTHNPSFSLHGQPLRVYTDTHGHQDRGGGSFPNASCLLFAFLPGLVLCVCVCVSVSVFVYDVCGSEKP